MQLSLGAAARAAGVAKSTVSKAVSTGKLSAEKQDNGSYKIDSAELFRVFPKTVQNGQIGRSETSSWTLEHQFERERELLLDQVRDLRARLDRSEARAEALTAMLTDRRVPDSAASPAPAPRRRRFWPFGRR